MRTFLKTLAISIFLGILGVLLFLFLSILLQKSVPLAEPILAFVQDKTPQALTDFLSSRLFGYLILSIILVATVSMLTLIFKPLIADARYKKASRQKFSQRVENALGFGRAITRPIHTLEGIGLVWIKATRDELTSGGI
jgi:hypothetical protein